MFTRSTFSLQESPRVPPIYYLELQLGMRLYCQLSYHAYSDRSSNYQLTKQSPSLLPKNIVRQNLRIDCHNGFHPLDDATGFFCHSIVGSTLEVTMKSLFTVLRAASFSNAAFKTANAIKAAVHSTTSGSGLSCLTSVTCDDKATQFPKSH